MKKFLMMLVLSVSILAAANGALAADQESTKTETLKPSVTVQSVYDPGH